MNFTLGIELDQGVINARLFGPVADGLAVATEPILEAALAGAGNGPISDVHGNVLGHWVIVP
jgi:hypothetical protein